VTINSDINDNGPDVASISILSKDNGSFSFVKEYISRDETQIKVEKTTAAFNWIAIDKSKISDIIRKMRK
jgi:hypothetical protein